MEKNVKITKKVRNPFYKYPENASIFGVAIPTISTVEGQIGGSKLFIDSDDGSRILGKYVTAVLLLLRLLLLSKDTQDLQYRKPCIFYGV